MYAPLTGVVTNRTAAAVPAVAAVVLWGAGTTGLAQADVTYQDAVAGGGRLVSLYQSTAAPTIGPLAGTQPSDGRLLDVIPAVLAHNSSKTGFVAALAALGVTGVRPDNYPNAFTYGVGGTFTSTTAIRNAVPSKLKTPAGGLLAFASLGDAFAHLGQRPATTVSIGLPGITVPFTWTFNISSGLWTPGPGTPGVPVNNLIIQLVTTKSISLDRGNTIYGLIPLLTGRGTETAVSSTTSGGKLAGVGASGVWNKPGDNVLTTYGDAQSFPLRFARGHTWVVLVPSTTKVTLS